jgi:hypothetical protein
MNKKTNFDMSQLVQAVAAQQQRQQTTNTSWLSYWETLSLVLLVLNAMGFISISYFLVFLPLFIPVVVYLIILMAGFIKAKFTK